MSLGLLTHSLDRLTGNGSLRPPFGLPAKVKVKEKVRLLALALLIHESDSRPQSLYNLWYGSWLPAHFVAIHDRANNWIAVQPAGIPPPQSAAIGLHFVVRKQLLISFPALAGNWIFIWKCDALCLIRVFVKSDGLLCWRMEIASVSAILWINEIKIVNKLQRNNLFRTVLCGHRLRPA